MRIVSLIASATEMVCALGLEECLVGRSHECDYPESVRRLPVCTEPKFEVEGSSLEIDQRVKSLLQEGLSVYRVREERLRDLRPDVIVTQSQCEVCAVNQSDVESAIGDWTGNAPVIVSLAPQALEDVWTDIRRLAGALGVSDRGESLEQCLRDRVWAIRKRADSLSQRPTVACVEWIDPLMAAGNWMPELVELAGGKNLFGQAGRHAPAMTWDQLKGQDPDVIIVMPCGWNLEQARKDMPILVGHPGWEELTAVRKERVYLADGNQFFNRPGPRLVESLEILAEIVHPDQFHFGHQGKGWERFSKRQVSIA